MSQAWQIHHQTNNTDPHDPAILQNLTLQSVPKPTLGPGQVLVRLHAAALNYRDILIIAHSPVYPVQPIDALVPCSDGAGVVEAVGLNSKWSVGEKVVLASNHSWHDEADVSAFDIGRALGGGDIQGTLQRYRVVDDKWVVRMPANLSFEDAAALPTAYGTAWNALVHVSGLGGWEGLRGKTVLTQGTGGVSCAAVQIARAAGARVISTTGEKGKMERLSGLGAEEVLNYRENGGDWAEVVLGLMGGRGVDVVVDVGGAGTIEQSLKAVRHGGMVVVLGILTQAKSVDLVPAILFGAKTGECSPSF